MSILEGIAPVLPPEAPFGDVSMLASEAISAIKEAAQDQRRVEGLTHRFYRYPARFSPNFARTCIEVLSKPGDLVLDPYMGGGTTVLEAMVAGRRAVGSDINSLAVFIASVKTAPLDDEEECDVTRWAKDVLERVRCTDGLEEQLPSESKGPRNMGLPEVRWLRKTIALAMAAADDLRTERSRRFARCVILNTGQWALDGRRGALTAGAFRKRLVETAAEMLRGIRALRGSLSTADLARLRPLLREIDAEVIDLDHFIHEAGPADLVVTSPPYPGIHLLYHRWQVDGRKETDAPYWIADCRDGAGAAHYNFADRRREAEARYFEKAQRSFSAIRRVLKSRGILAQMVAFSEPDRQLPRYLDVMAAAGFRELRESGERRIWRTVPGRKWHATHKGALRSAREVVLIHAAE